MAKRTTRELPGQIALPVNEERPRINLAARNAFGRVTTPEYWGISPEPLLGVTVEELDQLNLPNLQACLFATDGPHVFQGVTLNPAEYTTIVRHPRAFGQAAIARTLKARALDDNIDRRLATSQRAASHAFSAKAEAMSKMLDGLTLEHDQLARLQKEIRSPGFAHMNEGEMRMLSAWVWDVSFRNILNVAGLRQSWDGQRRERMDTVLMRHLLWGPQRARVGYWGGLVELALRYSRARASLTRQRIAQAERQKG